MGRKSPSIIIPSKNLQKHQPPFSGSRGSSKSVFHLNYGDQENNNKSGRDGQEQRNVKKSSLSSSSTSQSSSKIDSNRNNLNEYQRGWNSSIAFAVDNEESRDDRRTETDVGVLKREKNSTELSTALDASAKDWHEESNRVIEGKGRSNEIDISVADGNALQQATATTSAATKSAATLSATNTGEDAANTDASHNKNNNVNNSKSMNRHDNLQCLCDSDDYSPLFSEEDLDDLFEDLVDKVREYNPEAVRIASVSKMSRGTVDDGGDSSNVEAIDHGADSQNSTQQISSSSLQSPTSQSMPLLEQAYLYAKAAHSGQCRKSGEPYITHPIGVASIIADMKLDLPSLLTALLHDTVEDTSITLSDISQKFGDEISNLVDGVTKVGRLPYSSSEEIQSENYRKLILAMSRDIRVVLVKLADRAHNMRTLQYMSPEKQRKIAKETMDIYAPLAHRLGIYWIKTELEDNCFRYLYPEEFEKLEKDVLGREEERKEYEREVVEIFEREMREAGVGGDMDELVQVNGGSGIMAGKQMKTLTVTGRTKGLWSIFSKMKQKQIEFDDVHDVIGFRIIVQDVQSCYAALGAVHSNWKPVPGKIKDYIALPKPNGYRSLHTTIIGPHKKRIEVQIRTQEMHEVAESGIAAHFLYKEGGSKTKGSDDSTRFAWLRELVNEVRRTSDPVEFVNAVKQDLFLKEVLVFSPGGDLYALPRGSSVLDFAYKVHSELGNHCAGAKVNGKQVSLKHQIKSGDMIEITRSIHQTPKREWIQFVKTSKAKNRIRAWLKRRQREHSIVVGKEIINRGLKEYNPRGDDSAGRKEYARKLDHILSTFKLRDEKHLFTALGYGQVSIKNVMTEVFGAAAIATRGNSHSINKKEKDDQFVLQSFENSSQDSLSPNNAQFATLSNLNGIVVGQERNIMLKFCKNCSPLRGEKIKGTISKGKGVKVHRLGCKYLLEADEKRVVELQWDDEATNTAVRPVQLAVLCEDNPGVLANMSRAISSAGFNIGNVSLRKSKNGRGLARLEVMMKSLEDLESVMRCLRQEEGILNVSRR